MSDANSLALPAENAKNVAKQHYPLSKSPISGDSASIEIDDHDVIVQNAFVNTSLLRRLSLVEEETEENKFGFRRHHWFKILIVITCITNVISVCLNTPKMFIDYPNLLKVTLGLDLTVACILTAEALMKIAEKGFFSSNKAYLKSPGRVFEFIMVFFTWISIVFHVLEAVGVVSPTKINWYNVVSGLRSPRPCLLFRVAKNILHVGIPKNVSKKPLRQIRNVFLFTIFAITIVAIIGVQIFGNLSGYCLKTKSASNDTSIHFSDLMIPLSRCNIYSPSDGYNCPKTFTCKEVKIDQLHVTMHSYFKHTGVGLLTVYEAQTQEGWTKVMYETMDSAHDLKAVVYFILLIIFIAWLTKNIFIAIVTEVFADLRSQVHTLYSSASSKLNKNSSKVFIYHKSDVGLQLVQGDEIEKEDVFRSKLRRLVRSFVFTWFFLICIIVDAMLQGLLAIKQRIIAQIVFTILFDIEVGVKILAFGAKNYLGNVPHRFEFLLAVGSSAFLTPLCLQSSDYEKYALFQVMRPVRLILAWPSLASFLKRILGSGRKLGSLLLFTGILIIVASGVSLQLFCNIKPSDGKLFQTFPSAAEVMFQVLMQEAWNEALHDMLIESGPTYYVLVFVYFILYHMLAAVILISVFVALILDNLEFDEEVKIMKQHHLREVTDINYKMPLRLRIFQKMKARPRIVKMENIGCSIPKVRESFMSNYLHDILEQDSMDTNLGSRMHDNQFVASDIGVNLLSITTDRPNSLTHKELRKQSSVSALIKLSHQRKCMLDGSASLQQMTSQRRRGSTIRRRRYSHQQSIGGSILRRDNTIQERALDYGAFITGTLIPTQFRLSLQSDGNSDKDLDAVRQRLREAQCRKEAQLSNLRENFPYFDKSLFFLPYDNKFREFIRQIVHARYVAFSESSEQRLFGAFSLNRFKKYLGSQTYLDWLMMLLTHISCWALFLETSDKRAFQYEPTKYIEYIFVVTTTIEIGLKILADGLILTPTALLKDFGGILHVFIYIVGLVHLCWHPLTIKPNSFAQQLLVLRALRPLRIITLAPPLRNVVQIFVRGYKDILKVAILQLLLMFVFAIYGVQMFQNRLGLCTDPQLSRANCTGICLVTLVAPKMLGKLSGNPFALSVPCVWRNPRNFNFDNLENAFLALFEVLSLEGWTNVRDILTERVGSYASLYLHIYVFLACLIGLSLFIGVVVSNFNQNKGTALLTVDQRRWEDLKKRLKLSQPIHLPPRPENDEQRGRIYDILQTKLYRFTYVCIVLLNGLTLVAVQWYPISLKSYEKEDKELHISFTAIAIVFTYTYLIDLVIKLFCYRFAGYWLSWRNKFDCLLTALGVIWSIFQVTSYWYISIHPVTLQVGVSLIIFRLFSLFGKINSIKMIILTLGMSLIKSFYTISVLFVIMWCYALIGVIMFGSTRFGIALNRHANFRNSLQAMMLLFRITTGEDWNRLMHDCTVSPPRCSLNEDDNYWETDCGHPFVAHLYFFSYYVIVTYIFWNLFIAVVIENFSLFSSTDEDMLMSDSDIKVFQEVWNIIDTDRSGKLTAKRAKLAIGLSITKLKYNLSSDRFLYKRMCAEVDKISNGKEISFHDLLLVLAYNDSRVKPSRNLQLEERLAREDQIRLTTEEVAAQTIRTWCLRMWRERIENRRNPNRSFAKQSGCFLFSLSI